jgi:hypothetical protein
MAGYSAVVCLPAEAAEDLHAALAEALAPFGETSNLVEWDFGFLWDTWRIDGAAEGYGFWAAAGYEQDPRLHFDDPYWNRPADLRLPGFCAGGPRKLLDLSPSPALGRELATRSWDLWQRLLREHPPALPIRAFVARHQKSPHHWFDHELVTSEFEAQPLVREYLAAQPLGGRDPKRYSSKSVFTPHQLIEFTGDAESFADTVVANQLGWMDLVTIDGWWIESCGRRANHGSCGSACEHTFTAFDPASNESGFAEAQLRYLRSLPDDALIVRIHGHC